jgi:hypothetical protein
MYASAKLIWYSPDEFGESRFVIMKGGLLIEMAYMNYFEAF